MIAAVPACIIRAEPNTRTPVTSAERRETSTVQVDGPTCQEPSSAGAPAIARRLTPEQYRRAISDAFGSTIRVEGRFEPGVRDDGLLAVGAGHVGVTATGLEQFD